MRESDFTAQVCRLLTQCNCMVLAFVASQMQAPGIPDRWVAGRGLPEGGVWLEFKSKNGSLREDQQQILRKMDERGVPNLVVREIAGGIAFEDRGGRVHGSLNFPTNGIQLREAICHSLRLKSGSAGRSSTSASTPADIVEP